MTDERFDARGLSEAAARALLHAEGANELPRGRARTFGDIALENAREPMFLLMLGAAALYLVVGDLGEGAFLVAAAGAAMGLVIAQETRSETALAALRELAQPTARVVRDGVERSIPTRELAAGDLMLVGEGERMAADALLVSGDALMVDESALTGESAPVGKRHARAGEVFSSETSPGPEASPFLFAGTLITRGQGVAVVGRTGARSALGQIGKALGDIRQEPTPLQKGAGRIVALLGAVALGFCALVALAYGYFRGDWVGGALAGITVAISLIPEEFPMVLGVFLALGAWRLAAHRVLVRRNAVIEALGAATLLCVDKTGTLTENRMRVARVWTGADVAIDGVGPGEGAAAGLLQSARLASAVRPVDPMDKAIDALVGPPQADGLRHDRSWPLTSDRMAFVQAWRGSGLRLAAKGAPEAVFALCRLGEAERARLQDVVVRFARDGLRVLGVASADCAHPIDAPEEAAWRFDGFIGFVDPLRADVRAALEEAKQAGVKVAMITGDHPETALAIGEAAGIDTKAGVLLGAEAAELPFPTLCERLREIRVFARVTPAQKLLLVEAFKTDGEIVAMTGDGVNDAPALEAAHIGIAMGKRGTDVAREAADLVLLDDSFASIVGGVRLGRRIFANLRNALIYITAIHVPIAGVALAPIVLGLPPLLFPMHVVLLELAIDPTCALVFEAERSDARAMLQPPRGRDETLFGTRELATAIAQGAGLLVGVLALYAWGLQSLPEAQARGAAFLALVVGNLVLALADSMASGDLFARHRRIYWLIVSAVAGALVLVFAARPLADMFGIASAPLAWMTGSVALAAATGVWAALVKRRNMGRARP
ncbi:MAG: cation-translocating P-type ATPase [Hyphomonadaceae bacterium]|nr:cation-translocating P-type ATPase [Hyphomonadaceae bacterium]